MPNSRSLIPLSFVSSLQKGPQMPCQFSLASLLCIPVSLHNKNVLLRCLINGILWLVVEFFHFVVIIDQNHTKGSQERFLTGQNKAKCANFRGNCLFQSYVLLATTTTTTTTYLLPVGFLRKAEGTELTHRMDDVKKEKKTKVNCFFLYCMSSRSMA